jgi:orotate phosphoribosyltransferase
MSAQSAFTERALLESGGVSVDLDSGYEFAGLKSPVYIDTRRLLSYPALRKTVSQHLTQQIADELPPADAVVAVANGGIPWASWISAKLDLPLLYTIKNRNRLRRPRGLWGDLERSQACVVVDDLIKTGNSSALAVDAVRQAGGEVVGLASVFTYELPHATRLFHGYGVPHVSSGTLTSLLAVAEDLIDPREVDAIRHWGTHVMPVFVPAGNSRRVAYGVLSRLWWAMLKLRLGRFR